MIVAIPGLFSYLFFQARISQKGIHEIAFVAPVTMRVASFRIVRIKLTWFIMIKHFPNRCFFFRKL